MDYNYYIPQGTPESFKRFNNINHRYIPEDDIEIDVEASKLINNKYNNLKEEVKCPCDYGICSECESYNK